MVTKTVVGPHIGLRFRLRLSFVPLSPNFSCTIYSDAIRKWEGKGLVLPHCIEIWGAAAPRPHSLNLNLFIHNFTLPMKNRVA